MLSITFRMLIFVSQSQYSPAKDAKRLNLMIIVKIEKLQIVELRPISKNLSISFSRNVNFCVQFQDSRESDAQRLDFQVILKTKKKIQIKKFPPNVRFVELVLVGMLIFISQPQDSRANYSERLDFEIIKKIEKFQIAGLRLNFKF